MKSVLVHLASGIGNIVLATPLLVVLDRCGVKVDVLLDGDYPEITDLLTGWGAVREVFDGRADELPTAVYDIVIPAIPPFYWHRYRTRYVGERRCVRRPSDALFYRDEQGYYLEFARNVGCDIEPPPA